MTPSRRSTVLTRGKYAVLSGLLGAGLLLSPVALAQESTPPAGTPVASPQVAEAAQATVTNLITAQIDEIPEAPFTVRMLRITLQPGAITSMHSHHGPEVDLVESGEVIIRSQGDAPVVRADGTEEVSSGEDVVLGVGDSVHFPAEVGMYFENASDEPVVMLSAVVIPVGPDYVNERITWLEGEPNLEGVSYQKLGDGLVQEQPQTAAEWTIDLVELPPAVPMPAVTGISMITPIQGNFSFTIDAGMVQVTRAESNMLQPNAVLDTTFSLADADAAFFPSGVSATGRANEQQPLTLLIMNIEPEDGVVAEPAEITFSAGDGTVAGSGSEATVGQVVTTNTGDVNMRAEPNVNADVVDQLAAGIELEVLGGPEEADDYVWYQVRVVDGGSEGWVVADFLDGIDTPVADDAGDGTSGDESGDETTPSSTPQAGEFAVGSTVVTNDENVRLRPEPSAEGEPLNALPQGTVLTVTGEPVEGGDFTWIPVETEDGVAGYIAIDFLEGAP